MKAIIPVLGIVAVLLASGCVAPGLEQSLTQSVSTGQPSYQEPVYPPIEPQQPVGGEPPATTTPTEPTAEPGEPEVPSISYQDCLTQIKQTNPDMPDQAAQDNCLIIEAINTQDSSLCGQVSEPLRQICLDQF